MERLLPRIIFFLIFATFPLSSFAANTAKTKSSKTKKNPNTAYAPPILSDENNNKASLIRKDIQDSLTAKEDTFFPDILDSESVTLPLLNLPGYPNPDFCSDRCKVIAEVSSSTSLRITGKVEFNESVTPEGPPLLNTYVEVEYINSVDKQKQKGWVNIDFLKRQGPKDELWTKVTETIAETKRKANLGFDSFHKYINSACENIRKRYKPEPFIPSEKDIHRASLKALEDAKKQKESVDLVTNKIEKLAGQCVLDPPNHISEESIKGPLTYDSLVIPKLIHGYKDGSPSPFLEANKLKVPGLNPQTLMAIDARARTIYAEMANCISIGEQYSMAVARVIQNREEKIEAQTNDKNRAAYEDQFIRPKKEEAIRQNIFHFPLKSSGTKVATSPVQFTTWNMYRIDFEALALARKEKETELLNHGKTHLEAKKLAIQEIKPDANSLKYYQFNESGLLHSLCPPSDQKKKFYADRLPKSSEYSAWKAALRAATESVLYRTEFQEKTNQLKDVLHYTSGRTSFEGFVPLNPKPSIEGRVIDSDRCLNLWVKKPKTDTKTPRLKTDPQQRKTQPRSKTNPKNS